MGKARYRGQSQLTSDEVNHHDKVLIVAVSSGTSFDHLEHVIEPFHICIGDPMFPVF